MRTTVRVAFRGDPRPDSVRHARDGGWGERGRASDSGTEGGRPRGGGHRDGRARGRSRRPARSAAAVAHDQLGRSRATAADVSGRRSAGAREPGRPTGRGLLRAVPLDPAPRDALRRGVAGADAAHADARPDASRPDGRADDPGPDGRHPPLGDGLGHPALAGGRRQPAGVLREERDAGHRPRGARRRPGGRLFRRALRHVSRNAGPRGSHHGGVERGRRPDALQHGRHEHPAAHRRGVRRVLAFLEEQVDGRGGQASE